MTRFDSFVMVDWSGGNDRGARPKADAIWACVAGQDPVYLRNRQVAEVWLGDLIAQELAAGRRLCLGFDFPFGYPAGFAEALTGAPDPLALWDWLEARIEDTPEANNRFDLAGQINQRFGGRGPFWGNGLKRDIPGLPRNKDGYDAPFAEGRKADQQTPGAFSPWQLSGAGAVGSQVLMGLPVLARLRRRFAGQVAVWPFEPLDPPVAFLEVWPSLLAEDVRAELARDPEQIKDAVQVRLLADRLAALPPARLASLLAADAPEEGWIFASGRADDLRPVLTSALTPPPLRNDCFALPPGVDWTPVDQALDLLQERMRPVTPVEDLDLWSAQGRILAAPLTAQRANPPLPNTAVDGYGFAGPAPEGPVTLPLHPGRAAAGLAYDGIVPPGHAIRILTGASLPAGVDTVVLEEDVRAAEHAIAFNGPLKRGANTRKAGEDVEAGAEILPAGRRLTPADLALAAATGLSRLPVRAPLRVGVLSTGDEVIDPGQTAQPGQIFDANRPMLLALVRAFGAEPVDLGRAPDDRAALRAMLDQAAGQADAILTSGGASAGDEDHVSALLQEAGAMQEWRIAVKPGRPLALGLWQGKPVFGLPGNPVAAMVCTLIFARPALLRLAGAAWSEPQGFDLPAAFEKRKKPGRREYLRARVRDGQVEAFHSEGSGRISGLSWADGLVELGDGAAHIRPGDPVRYIPFSSLLS